MDELLASLIILFLDSKNVVWLLEHFILESFLVWENRCVFLFQISILMSQFRNSACMRINQIQELFLPLVVKILQSLDFSFVSFLYQLKLLPITIVDTLKLRTLEGDLLLLVFAYIFTLTILLFQKIETFLHVV